MTLSGTFMSKMMVFPMHRGGLLGIVGSTPTGATMKKHGTFVRVIHAIMGILRLHGFILKTGMGWWPSPNMDLSWIYLIHPKFEDVFVGGFNHLEKYESQLGRIIPNIWWKNKIHVPNHQPVICVWGLHHFQTHPIDIFSWFHFCIQWYIFHCTWYHLMIPSGKLTKSYWKWPFIVDLHIKHGGSFHSYVTVYQRVSPTF